MRTPLTWLAILFSLSVCFQSSALPDGCREGDVLIAGFKFRSGGNLLLRRLVAIRFDDYEAADAKSDCMDVGTKLDRQGIKDEMIEAIRSNGGRFMKIDKVTGTWVEATDKEARKMVGDELKRLRLARRPQVPHHNPDEPGADSTADMEEITHEEIEALLNDISGNSNEDWLPRGFTFHENKMDSAYKKARKGHKAEVPLPLPGGTAPAVLTENRQSHPSSGTVVADTTDTAQQTLVQDLLFVILGLLISFLIYWLFMIYFEHGVGGLFAIVSGFFSTFLVAFQTLRHDRNNVPPANNRIDQEQADDDIDPWHHEGNDASLMADQAILADDDEEEDVHNESNLRRLLRMFIIMVFQALFYHRNELPVDDANGEDQVDDHDGDDPLHQGDGDGDEHDDDVDGLDPWDDRGRRGDDALMLRDQALLHQAFADEVHLIPPEDDE